MTYPQQQSTPQQYGPPPSQGYGYAYPPAGQQPQYGAPQGTPWMPPAYGGAPAGTPPQQPAPAPQFGGQGLPTTPPPLGQSARTGEGGPKSPQPRHLIGRTVIFEPIRIDETTTVKNDAGQDVSRPTAYYNLTVVDGGPLTYGDNRSQKIDEQHGMTLETQVPARFLNCQSDRWGIVQEIRDTMARGELASVGVIVQGTKGTKGSPPFLVTKCARNLDGSERPDGDERFAAATQVWNAIFSKTFTSPEPRSLVAPPTAAAPQVQYQPTAPAGYASQQYQQTGTVPTPYGAAPAGQLHPEYVAAATGYGYQPPQPVAAPPVNPAFEAWLATLPPEQQAAQRAALAGQSPNTGPQGPGI